MHFAYMSAQNRALVRVNHGTHHEITLRFRLSYPVICVMVNTAVIMTSALRSYNITSFHIQIQSNLIFLGNILPFSCLSISIYLSYLVAHFIESTF